MVYTNIYGIAQSSMTKGLLTGSKEMVLDMGTWLTSVKYYDDKARVIQDRRQLYDGSNGGSETSSSLYDFSGKATRSKQSQTFNGNITTMEQWNTYDHMGRLTKTEQEVNGTSHTTTAQLAYNELGQMVNKNVGTIESTDYLYNIRGWLSKVNDPDALGSKLFAMNLLYNEQNSGLGNAQQYNGNISGLIWNSTGKVEQGYVYSYDPLNRLTNSDYQIYNNGWTQSTAYEEKNLTYDQNGNINHLERSDNSGNNIANYTYNYDASNKLQNINSGTSYTYDANGNTTTDGLRSMAISYNMLNLPQTISKGGESISYIYTATGEKVAKRMKDNSYQYYAGNFIYNSDKTLNYLLFSEGRVVNSSGALSYDYQLKDHLGNTRVAFSSSHTATQVSDYYAFGSSFAPHSPNNDNKYLYNGKELQDDVLSGTNLDWLDYGARFYDPQIGRFTKSDRFAEKYFYMSPYQYGALNPIKNIDINGDSLRIINKGQAYLYQNGKLYQNGLEYTGKVKGFLKNAVHALGEINGGKEGESMLSELEGSKNNFSIVEGDSKFNESSTTKAYANQLQTDPSQTNTLQALTKAGVNLQGGSGGTISWNPSGSELPTTNGGQTNSITDLAHEMFHGLDANRGMLNDNMQNGVKISEWQAVYRENVLRGQLGQPLRTNYIKVVDQSGAYAGGNGVRMITTANQPILPLGYKP